MLGLNDAWIPKHGIFSPELRPGHRHHATMKYLLDRHVNLIVGHPKVIELGPESDASSLPKFHFPKYAAIAPPPDAKFLEIPIANNQIIYAIYLCPHAEVEQVIKERSWRTFPIVRE